jgi:uncharacterized surface protein with fasciclin (FAS1) repeats
MADTISDLEGCKLFSDWLRNAGLEYLLRRSGLHTLFVPNDAAFEGGRPGDPEHFLNEHLLSGGMETFDLTRCKTVKSLAGNIFPVQSASQALRIGDARILRGDIPCTNGVVHIVDAFITPRAKS